MERKQSNVAKVVRRVQGGPPIVLALATAVALLPVGVVIWAVGLLVLHVAGGAAHDTSMVLFVVAMLVTDFWGGGIMHVASKLPAQRVVPPWVIARSVVLVILAVLIHALVWIVPIMIVLAIPAAYAGARTSTAQARMAQRRHRSTRTRQPAS